MSKSFILQSIHWSMSKFSNFIVYLGQCQKVSNLIVCLGQHQNVNIPKVLSRYNFKAKVSLQVLENTCSTSSFISTASAPKDKF